MRDIQRELLSSKEVERAVIEFNARSLVDRLAVCLAGCVLMQDGDPIVAKCYLKTRLPMNGNVVPHNLGGEVLSNITCQNYRYRGHQHLHNNIRTH